MTADEMTRIGQKAGSLAAEGRAYAIATVVRTVGPVSAKPGSKALLLEDGSIAEGWIGGGCARSALKRAALDAIAEGRPQFISLRPEEVLQSEGVAPGEDREGVHYARNGCPSKGSMDIFVEPVLPRPELIVLGASPVAMALADLAGRFDFEVARLEDPAAMPARPAAAGRYVVVASQGAGDVPLLRAALECQARHVAFVGSRRKFAALAAKLEAMGLPRDALGKVSAPAGLHIDAVTPEEIALSILAQAVQLRRRGQRAEGADD